jgi:hypothetical protein
MARARSGMRWRGALLGVLLLPAVALAGGTKGKGPARPERGTGGSGRCDQTTIQSLESQARSLAVAEGCTEVSQCKTAPVGVRACGGPRDYLVYCSVTTNEDALLRELERLQKSEAQYNEQCGVMSICIFTAEPQVDLVNGVCQKAEPAPTTLP